MALLVPAGSSGQAAGEPRFLFKFGRGAIQTPTTFNYETGLAVDSITGDVWVPGAPIKRFDANGNFILSTANCGACMGMDVNLVNHDLYVANPFTAEVFQYAQNGAFVRKWGSRGSGPGEFNAPNDVSIDSGRGEIYVIDGLRVQVFDLNGTYLREWGSKGPGPGQFSGFTGNYGVAFDPGTDTVFASDAIADRIQVFDRLGNYITGWDDAGGGTGPGQMRWARNIDVDAAGNVYEVDSDNERIQVFSPQGNYLTEFMGPHNLQDGAFHPRAVAINRTTGEKYVMAAYAQRIDKFDADNNHVLSWGDRERDGAVLWGPKGVAVSDVTGDVFVMDSFNFLVKRFTRTGVFLNQWGGSNRLDGLGDGRYGFDANGLFGFDRSAIATDRFGDPWTAGGGIHYTCDPFLNSTRHFDPLGTFVSGFHIDLNRCVAWNESIWRLVIDRTDDRIYLADATGIRIRVHEPDGTLVRYINLPSTPAGLALFGDSLYVALPATNSIRKYTRDGTFLTEWGSQGTGNGQFRLDSRSGIAVDRTGIVAVADTVNNRIQFFDADGNFLRAFGSAGAGNGRFNYPVDLTVAWWTQTLYVADTGNNRIQAFSLDGAPGCFDGLDNDGDGLIDHPADPGCVGARDASEGATCGLGPELALLLPPLLAARRRRQERLRSEAARAS